MSSLAARRAPPTGPFRFIPALDSLRRYRLADARADVVAGLTVAAVAVPQAMAYAMVAGVPAEYGLYTAIVMTAVGAIFDSSKQLINGPTNAISIAVLSAVAVVDGADQKIQAAILLAFMVGSIQLAIALCRLGDLTRYISHAVIVGFTLGAGALLVLDQLKNLLGMHAVGDGAGPFPLPLLADAGGRRRHPRGHRSHRPRHHRADRRAALVQGVDRLAAAARVSDRGRRDGRVGGATRPRRRRGCTVIGEIPAKLPHFAAPAASTPT